MYAIAQARHMSPTWLSTLAFREAPFTAAAAAAGRPIFSTFSLIIVSTVVLLCYAVQRVNKIRVSLLECWTSGHGLTVYP